MSRINFPLKTEFHSYCLCSCPWLCTNLSYGNMEPSLPWNNTVFWDVKQESSTYKWLFCRIESSFINIPDPKSINWHIRINHEGGGGKLAEQTQKNRVILIKQNKWGAERERERDYLLLGLRIMYSQWTWAVKVLLLRRSAQLSGHLQKTKQKKPSHAHPSLHYLHY